jgi:hypothetical protein
MIFRHTGVKRNKQIVSSHAPLPFEEYMASGSGSALQTLVHQPKFSPLEPSLKIRREEVRGHALPILR